MGSAVGRNESCPCGSGAKYKKCCLRSHEAAAAARLRGHPWDADPDTARNSALDLIGDGRYDEAIAITDRLQAEFPDLPDGHELRARVLEAQGHPSKAATELRKLRAQIAYLGQRADFDPEFHEWIDEEIERLTAVTPGAAAAGPSPH